MPWRRLIPRVEMLTTTGPLGTAQAGLPTGQFSRSGTGLSLEGPVPESLSCGLRLSANFYAYGNRSLPPRTGPRELDLRAGAVCCTHHLREPVPRARDRSPRADLCAGPFLCRNPAYGNRSLIPGTSPRVQNLPSADFALFALVDSNSNTLFGF
uniref:Uncharacterized protein n=1 Tax=Ananas comosus var. bracteatus TaxID=296719 RepID=A0A6V7PH88_ANACO|nr:unnamed protein product [Ananas comosus var. bracteatus]